MSTVEVGRAAEIRAADWLIAAGFKVMDRNWRTRWCEIDIVAECQEVISFVEVKYRRRSDFGTGFEYITPNKARRLRRAALMWLSSHYRTQAAYQIDVIAVSGYPKPQKVDYLPNAIGEG